MSDTAWIYAALFGMASAVGVRSSWKLTQRYLRVREALRRPIDRLLLELLVFISWSITLAACYFGAFTVRRMLGFPPVDWNPPISAAIATAILFIPLVIERVVKRVAESREREANGAAVSRPRPEPD